MSTALLLASLLVVSVSYDVMLRFALFVRPRTTFETMSAFHHVGAHRVLSLARAFCGFRIHILPYSGRLPSQCLVISNHQSLVDIPVLMEILPQLNLRFVAKRELRFGVPMVSLTLRAGRHALIARRKGSAEASRALRTLARLAKRGVSPAVFPEGTRSGDGEVARFHVAAVRVLSETTALPILSVAVEGGYRISRLRGVARNVRSASYRVQALTLYPPPRTRSELVDVLSRSHDEIAATIRSWREAAARSPRT